MLKELTFVISTENHPDLLAHRDAPAPAAPRMRITLEVSADFEQSDRIAAQLAKIVDVVSIETLKHDHAVQKQRQELVRKR
jgi:acetolactate synthase small subunit